jgi:hypothetical protein
MEKRPLARLTQLVMLRSLSWMRLLPILAFCWIVVMVSTIQQAVWCCGGFPVTGSGSRQRWVELTERGRDAADVSCVECVQLVRSGRGSHRSEAAVADRIIRAIGVQTVRKAGNMRRIHVESTSRGRIHINGERTGSLVKTGHMRRNIAAKDEDGCACGQTGWLPAVAFLQIHRGESKLV